MAQIPFRANMQTASFPLLSELSSPTIIDPGLDQTYVRGVSPAVEGQVPSDLGIPQVYYCHNVMPSTYGFQSVGYLEEYSGINWLGNTPVPVDFKTCYLIEAGQVISGKPRATGYRTYLAAPKIGSGSVFTLSPVSKNWIRALGAPVISETTKITVATINGVSYIFFSGIGAYIYDSSTNTLVPRTLAGLDTSVLIGIIASSGYLLAYSKSAVSWSSVVDVEDFVPSDVSGAGGGQVQEAKGAMVTAAATSIGFIIYTEANAVSVIYSGNADFPWNFKHIPASGGVASAELVSAEQIAGTQQVYSTNGFQQISHNGAKTVTPQITDFIAGNLYEDYDITSGTFTVQEFDWIMQKGLAVIADRYVMMSYGPEPTGGLTYCIVLDIPQGRMGKLKIHHNYAFELRSLTPQVTETPRGSIAFLQSNGDIQSVNFSLLAPAPDSVLLLGKYQYVRQRMLELFEVRAENIKTGSGFSIEALPTLDGKNPTVPQEGYLLDSTEHVRRYSFRDMVGTNISLLLKGRFNIGSLILWFAPHGRP